MQALKVQQFFEKRLIYFIIASIILGTLFGLYFPKAALALKPLVPVTLFIMLYPMMIGIQVEEIVKAVQNTRLILWSLLLNFIVSPLLGFAVARLLLANIPDFGVGLVLLAATPCAGMVVGWTGMARGNTPMALVIVALSLVLSIITIPFTMMILAGTLVKINALAMLKGTLLVILIPLVLGSLTRRIILWRSGQTGLAKIRPLLSPTSMLGMFAILFISLALGADRILARWESVFVAILAIIVFYVVQVVLSIWISERLGIAPENRTALVFSVVGKNVSLAVGLAAQFFSPLTVAMLAVNPLVQAPAMAWFLRWSLRRLPERGEA